MGLSRFARRRHTPAPRPIEPLPRFQAALAATCPGGRGPEVWISRDDLLGFSPGRHKTRKFEFLVADALARGADTLVTCGAPPSKRCRLMLAAAVKDGPRFDRVVVGSGSSGTHGGLVAGFLGNRIAVPIVGIRVSRDPAEQVPLVHAQAQAVCNLLGLGLGVEVPLDAVTCIGGCWRPKYSVPNPGIVEAVQRWRAPRRSCSTPCTPSRQSPG